MATIAQTILNGRLSVPLSANYGSKQSLFSGPVMKKAAPAHIMMVTDALDWMNDGGNYTLAEMTAVQTYLIWLYGRFGLTASSMTGSGGQVIPILPGTAYIYNALNKVVGTDDGPTNGASTYYHADLQDGTDLEYILVDNMPLSAGIDFTFDPVTATITLLLTTWVTGSKVIIPYNKPI